MSCNARRGIRDRHRCHREAPNACGDRRGSGWRNLRALCPANRWTSRGNSCPDMAAKPRAPRVQPIAIPPAIVRRSSFSAHQLMSLSRDRKHAPRRSIVDVRGRLRLRDGISCYRAPVPRGVALATHLERGRQRRCNRNHQSSPRPTPGGRAMSTSARTPLDRGKAKGSDRRTMPSLRAVIASLVIPGVVLLNCACVCSVATAPPMAGSDDHSHCRASGESGGTEHHRSPDPDTPSRQCPHCDHAQVTAALADSGSGAVAAPPLLISALPAASGGADSVSLFLKRPRAVVHSPPPLALLRQKCVLLI